MSAEFGDAQRIVAENWELGLLAGGFVLASLGAFRAWIRRPYGKTVSKLGVKVADNYVPNSNATSPFTVRAESNQILSHPKLGAMSKDLTTGDW